MIVTTSNAFEVLRIIKKIGIKNELMNSLKEISITNKKLESDNKKLLLLLIKENKNYLSLEETEKDKFNIKVLNENEELANEIGELQRRQEEVKERGIDWTVEKIKEIFLSENVQKLFTFATK